MARIERFAGDQSRDGKKLFCVGDNAIYVQSLADDSMQGPWEGHEGEIHALAESPDGTILASAGTDRTLRIWEVATGRPIAVWPAHDAEINALAFTPDGQTICSGDADGYIKVWDLPLIQQSLSDMGLKW